MTSSSSTRNTRSSRPKTFVELHTKQQDEEAVWEDLHRTIISTCSKTSSCRDSLVIQYLHNAFEKSNAVITIKKKDEKQGTKKKQGLFNGFALLETRMYDQDRPKKTFKIMFLHAIYGVNVGKELWTYINNYAIRSFVSYIFLESTFRPVNFYLSLGFVFYDTTIDSIAVAYQKSPQIHKKLQDYFQQHYHPDNTEQQDQVIGHFFAQYNDWNPKLDCIPMMYQVPY